MIKQVSEVDRESVIQLIVDAVSSDLPSFCTFFASDFLVLLEKIGEAQAMIPASQVDLRRQIMRVANEGFGATLKPYYDDDNDSELFLYESEGVLKGSIGFLVKSSVKQQHIGCVVWFWVREDSRASGVGASLFQALLDYVATCTNIKKLSAEIPAQDHSAVLDLFKRRGFELAVVQKKVSKFSDSYLDLHTVEKLIA